MCLAVKEIGRPEKIQKDVLVSTMLPGVGDIIVAKSKLVMSRRSVNFECTKSS